MQRRAAAAYAGLFILIAVGAYVMVGVAQEPAVTVENPDHSLGENDTLEIGDRAYTVSEINGSADAAERNTTLDWINESEKQTVTIANNSELPVINATWPGQTARMTSTFTNGSAVQYNGTAYTAQAEDGSFVLRVRNVSFSVGDTFPYQGNQTNVTAVDGENVTLTWNGSQNQTLSDGSTVSYNDTGYTLRVGAAQFNLTSDETVSVAVGDVLAYQGNRTTVTAVADGNATLAWGDAYNVTTRTTSNDTFTFRESFNVSAFLLNDPAVENETVSINGTSSVVYTNDTVQPLTEYLPDPEVKNFSVGDSFRYDTPRSDFTYDNVTVEAVEKDEVVLSWRSDRPRSESADHGANVTLGPDGQTFIAHFPDNDTLELTSDIEGYQSQLALQDSFKTRTDGLWGIVILSGLAAVFLIGASYLPSRY
jgi:hypothetical protein